MIKNIVQLVLSGIAIATVAIVPQDQNIWGIVAIIAMATLSAFESSRFISAFEVFLATIALVIVALGHEGLSYILLGLLAVWNGGQLAAPLAEALRSADGGGGSSGGEA